LDDGARPWTTAIDDPRLRAVVAVCAPLDLASSQATIDSPGRFLYRRYLLARIPRSLDLGEPGLLGLDGQVVAWLRRHG
jgi:hypothetical protein